MKRWKKCCTGLVALAGLTPSVRAQLPGAAPPAAAAAVAVAPAGGTAAAASTGPNLWNFLLIPPERKAACKEKFCASGIGRLVNNMLAPVSAFSGGLLGSCCPVATPADLAKPPDSAQGAAAQIKKDEAEAKARREAIRYMGTVDCHWWPEAQAALIGALRTDRNECVRLEAAWSLGRGCCCTKATVEALTITVNGSDKDSNPSENSERVRAAAAAALNHCLSCLPEAPVIPQGEPVKPGEPAKDKTAGNTGVHNGFLPAYYREVEKKEFRQIVREARQVMTVRNGVAQPQVVQAVATSQSGTPTAAAAASTLPARPAGHSVMEIVNSAVATSKKEAEPPMPVRHGRMKLVPLKEVEAMAEKSDPGKPVIFHPEGTVLPAMHPNPTEVEGKLVPQPTELQPSSHGRWMPTQSAHPPTAVIQSSTSFEMPASAPMPDNGEQRYHSLFQVVHDRLAERRSEAPVPMPVTSTPQVVPVTTIPQIVPVPITTTAPPPAQTSQSPYRPMSEVVNQQIAQTSYQRTVGQPSKSMFSKTTDKDAITFSSEELVNMLKTSPYVELRHHAATNLGGLDPKKHPEAVESLVTAARTDSLPTVKIACIRSLASMGMYTTSVIVVLQELRRDPNPDVRVEANQALGKLSTRGRRG